MRSLLESEIATQPEALERLLCRHGAVAAEVGPLLCREDVAYLVVAARGSSQNAARYAQYVLGRAYRVPVALATPSLFTLYAQPPRLDGALVVGISQSGRSPDVVAVLAEARRQGRPTIALTNAPSSPLADAADAVLDLSAGDEVAIAATKTYSNTIAAIALLFTAMAEDRKALAELRRMPEAVAAQIELTLADGAELKLGSRGGLTVLGRGVNYSTAHEIALKIRELAGAYVEAYSPADLMHGPIAALSAGGAALLVAPPGPAQSSVLSVAPILVGRGVDVAVIGETLQLVPDVPEWLSPLTAVVPGQVGAMRLAARLGRDVDRPEGLSKVTLTF